jgi:hypothetical protein
MHSLPNSTFPFQLSILSKRTTTETLIHSTVPQKNFVIESGSLSFFIYLILTIHHSNNISGTQNTTDLITQLPLTPLPSLLTQPHFRSIILTSHPDFPRSKSHPTPPHQGLYVRPNPSPNLGSTPYPRDTPQRRKKKKQNAVDQKRGADRRNEVVGEVTGRQLQSFTFNPTGGLPRTVRLQIMESTRSDDSTWASRVLPVSS